MKIFNQTTTHPSKVNFVDENNVLLGFDLDVYCCELFGWSITENKDDPGDDELHAGITGVVDMPGWVFDPDFFHEVIDEGGNGQNRVVFRIVNGDREKFIHLWNVHEGYYAHGFYFRKHDHVIREGEI